MKNNARENIDLHSINVFCKVIENKSFTKAAKTLFLSQPTISAHISKLEGIFGTKLLERIGNEIQPTKTGQILLKYGNKILKIKDEMIQSIYEFQGNISGNLLLGASTIPGEYMLPSLIAMYKKNYPNVNIKVQARDSLEVIELVSSGQTELGFVGSQPRQLAFDYFGHDNLVLIASPEYKWSKIQKNTKNKKDSRNTTEIDPDDLKYEQFIIRETGSGTRDAMERGLEKAGICLNDLKIVCELGSTEAVKQAVIKSLGISLISNTAVTNETKLNVLKTVKIKNLNIRRDFYMIHNEKRTISPIAQSFMQFIKNQISNL